MPSKRRSQQLSQARGSRHAQSSSGCCILLVQNDITRLSVDAIVNAANAQLSRGGGVCGSIFSAAGPALEVACAALQGCATGNAVLTEAFDIHHVKAIVHAVGPNVQGPLTDQHRRELGSSYARSLDVAVEHGLTSIAFPCISTAIYGFPNEEAARIALDAVKQWLRSNSNNTKLSRIVFCTYMDKDRVIYQRLLPSIFPDYVDDTRPALDPARGRSSTDNAHKPEGTRDVPVLTAQAALPAAEMTSMPPPPATQASGKRKRGRPQKTPTKGPAPKVSKAHDSTTSASSNKTDHTPTEVQLVRPGIENRSADDTIDKEQWIADRAALIDETEVAALLTNPETEMLTPAHVDTILQHLVLSHKRPLLLVSTVNSSDYETNHRALGLTSGLPMAEWAHIATAAVPAVTDDRVFGATDSFDLVIIPVFVPGHYVLGIYEAGAATIHYYDSLPEYNAYRCATVKIFLEETVRLLNARYRPGTRKPRYVRHADTTYAKQSDGSSCGFYVCYYVEAFLSLNRSSGFFMEDIFFMRSYRQRLLTLLFAVHGRQFPPYVPLVGFTTERVRGRTVTQSSFKTAPSTTADAFSRDASSRVDASAERFISAQATQFAHAVQSQFQQTASATFAGQRPPVQQARHAVIVKEAVQALLRSMDFAPADSALFPERLSPRAMFLYLRAVASMRPLPVVVASPMLALQKVFGKNAVPHVGMKLHKTPVNAHYVLIPYSARSPDSPAEYDDLLANVHWVVAIHSLEDNVTVVYDPAKTLSADLLASAETHLKNLAISIRRSLCRTSTAPAFAVANRASYTAFSSSTDSAFGVAALAECYISASVGGLLFKDFNMAKYKARMHDVFRQLHKMDAVAVKPLPGCRLVLASQQPSTAVPITTDPLPQDGPRRSTRTVQRSEKDKAAFFTRADLTMLCPMNAANCDDHKRRGLGCAALSVNHKVRYYDTGEFDKRCPHCDALLLASEVPRDGNQYTKCCAGGKVHTEAMQQKYESLQDMPEPLRQYAFNLPGDAEASNFNRNSKLYNNNVAFGSISSKRDPNVPPGRGVPACRINGEMTHRLCDMYPDLAHHENEQWAQHFIIDPAESLPKRVATLNRLRANPDYRGGAAINETVLEKVDHMLREHHPFASAYRTAHEVYQKAKEDAERQGKQLPQFRLILLNHRHDDDALRDDQGGTIHVHRAPDPAQHARQQNIAAIWVADDGAPPLFYGAYLYGKERGDFQELSVLDPNLDPALYPLLFPRGQQGYKLGLQLNTVQFTDQDEAEDEDDCIVARDMQGPEDHNARQFISGRQYDRYVSAHRGSDVTSPHWLYSKDKLAEFYAIDVANRREAVEFEEAKKKQQDKRLIAAQEFIEAMEKQLQRLHPGGKLGKVMSCKPTVKGSRPYMQRAFANAMTIFDRIGKPALFITFTGNPQWPEMQALLNGSGDTWLNHAQEAVRIFADKAYEFLNDVLVRQIFGVVTAYAISTELQMRGMPHLHCLFTLADDTPGLGTAAYVDEYISAELPDLPHEWRDTPEGRRQKRLYDCVVKFNVHDCNEWCLVGQPPRCNKRFPKPFSTQTIVTHGQYVQYERRAPRAGHEPDPYDDGESDDESASAPPASAAPRRRPPLPSTHAAPQDLHNYGNVCFKLRDKSEIMLHNGHVVPYSPFLTEKYQTHINVEYCLGTACVSYALKYIMKGHTLAFVTTEEVDDDGNPLINYDEYKQIQRCVFRTSAESALRTQGFPVVKLSHVVVELPVHAPGAESVAFVEGQEFAALDALAAGKKRSKLQAFFDMCREHQEQTGERVGLLYSDIGITHWFDPKSNSRCWNVRQRIRDNLLCRVLSVSPKNAETFAVRLLLHHVKGPTSFEDLRTVTLSSGIRWTYDTFTEAAQHYGLLENPSVWVKAIQEASREYGNPKRLRRYFASIVYNAAPPNPAKIFAQVLDDLWPPSGAPGRTEEWRKRKTLNHLEYCFRQFNTSCLEMLGIAVDGYDEQAALQDDELGGLTAHVGAGAGFRGGWKDYWEGNLRKMNVGQEMAFTAIINALTQHSTSQHVIKLFFLEGAGGTGKSFVENTILGWCRDHGFRAVATASTGIAATVLIGGKTMHSTFWIPLEVTADTESRVKSHAEYATPIKELQLIIVDEVSMLNRDVLTYVDTMLKDVCANKDEPFAGKVVVIGGDWKQLCPVVKGTERHLSRAAAVNASVKSLPMFRKFVKLQLTQNMRVKEGQREWAKYIDKVGNGKTLIPGTSEMVVDDDLLVPSEEELIAFTFPQELLDAPFANTAVLLEAAILAPKLDTVGRLNNRIREMLPGSDIVCESINTPLSENPLQMLNVHVAAQQVEHLNRRTEDGMPPHVLTFRPGMILVLMRNIDQQMGLCNGTRLQLLSKCGENLKCRVLSGPMSSSGGFVLIPKIRFEYGRKSDETNMDRFVRIQYPVIPAFAMTINKAQGQTLQRVGLHLGTQVFSHGQVYTAFSRATSREGIRIFNDRPSRPTYIVNIVYEELLDERSELSTSPVPLSQRIDRDEWPPVPGLGTTPPASWVKRAHELAATLHQDDDDSDSDDEFFSFPDGRAPDMGQNDHVADLDWVDKFFDLIAPEPSQAPDRNAFNHLFDSDEPVDPHAWDDDLSAQCKMTLTNLSITTLHVDAIVNAANDKLKFGSGVCGAIFRAAGRDQLQVECDKFNGCPTGEAVITGAYGITTVRKIIHAVGPWVKHGQVNDVDHYHLASCYTQSLQLAKKHGLRRIAFPCISTGIYGYPIEDATTTALEAVAHWLSQKSNAASVDNICFSVTHPPFEAIYRAQLPHYCAAYYDEVNDDIVPGHLLRTVTDDAGQLQSSAPSRMTVVVDSLSFRQPSFQARAISRAQSVLLSRVTTPYIAEDRLTQPSKWPQCLLDMPADEFKEWIGIDRETEQLLIDDEERNNAALFLKEREALDTRGRDRETATVSAMSEKEESDAQKDESLGSFYTPMEADDAQSNPPQVSLRAKKSDAQQALQAAFRTSFHQSQLKAAFQASFVKTLLSTDAENEGPPSPSISPARSSEEKSDSSQSTVSEDSTSTSSTSSPSDDEGGPVLGRMSRMSLHTDDFDGFVTPSAGSTPTKTQDAFSPLSRPLSLYATATPTKAEDSLSPAKRPLSLYSARRTPIRPHSAMNPRSPSESPRTQDAFPVPLMPSSAPTTPKKSPLKTAFKSMQKAASTIAKAALPGYSTAKAYKEFQKSVSEGNKTTQSPPDLPPPVPRHRMPHITEEPDQKQEDDSGSDS